MRVILRVSLLCSCIAFANAYATETPREKLTSDALAGHLRTGNQEVQEERIASARARLEEQARTQAQKEFVAASILRNGAEISEVAETMERFELELIAAEVKVPGIDGAPHTTVTIGEDYLLRHEGALADRLSRAVAYARDDLMEFSTLIEAEEPPDSEPLAFRAMRIYRIDIIGDAESLMALSKQPSIVAVFSADDPKRIQQYNSAKARYEEARGRVTPSPPRR